MSYSATVLADSPLVYYRCDDASGNPADSSGNGYTGTPAGSPTYHQASLLGSGDGGNAIKLNASSFDAIYVDNIGHPLIANLVAPWTIECWAKPTDSSNAGVSLIAQQLSGTCVNYSLGYGPDDGGSVLKAGFYDGSTWHQIADPGGAYTPGVAHHYVCTYDGTTVKFYIDGSSVGSLAATFTQTSQNTRAHIGRRFNNSPGQVFFNGTVDEVAIYSTVLSSTRVAAHYSAGSAPTTVPEPAGQEKDLQGELNRLAKTSGLGPAAAANKWAGTSGKSLVGALNAKAGNSNAQWKDLQGVCNQIAGTSGLAAPGALHRISA